MNDKKEGVGTGARVLDNVLGPEVYADSAFAFSNKNGVVSITFTSLRFDNSAADAPPVQVVVGRLVMPPRGAQDMAVGIFNWLKEHGFNAPPDTSTN